MFLYERVLILCKKQENTGDYNFKFEFELDGLKIEDDKSKQNRFRSGWKFFENFVKKITLPRICCQEMENEGKIDSLLD